MQLLGAVVSRPVGLGVGEGGSKTKQMESLFEQLVEVGMRCEMIDTRVRGGYDSREGWASGMGGVGSG